MESPEPPDLLTLPRARCRLLGLAVGMVALAVASSAAPATVELEGSDLTLSLAEAVERALRQNPTLIDARLRRRVERFDLAQAEQYFLPEVGFGTLSVEHAADLDDDASLRRVNAGPRILTRLPTGGAIDMSPSWSVLLDDTGHTLSEGAGVRLRLSQPLLRGGGFKVGTAPVRRARLAEAANVLAFEAATMDVVTSVIYRYRALIGAERRMAIDEGALERSRGTLDVNAALIDAGRMADTAIAETEAEIARRELALVRSRNQRDDALRDFNVLLNLPAGSRVVPRESASLDPQANPPELERALAEAREGNTGYRQALLSVENAALGVTLAENAMLWDLSLTADLELHQDRTPGSTGSALMRDLTRPYTVGLALSIPVGDAGAKARRRARLAARTAAERAEQALASTLRGMETNVQNGVRAVNIGLREVELAQRALELAASKLEVEQEKLRLGLSTNFRVTQFQADLVQAQVSELSARIGYLNAVTALDRIVGGTLATWNIDIEAMRE